MFWRQNWLCSYFSSFTCIVCQLSIHFHESLRDNINLMIHGNAVNWQSSSCSSRIKEASPENIPSTCKVNISPFANRVPLINRLFVHHQLSSFIKFIYDSQVIFVLLSLRWVQNWIREYIWQLLHLFAILKLLPWCNHNEICMGKITHTHTHICSDLLQLVLIK